MKITLKNIKYFPSLSEETHCFSATIYVDGVKAGEASNHGHGGSTEVHPRSLFEKLQAYGATLPRLPLGEGLKDQDGKPATYAQDAESIINDLLEDYLDEKDFKKLLAGHVVFTRTGQSSIYKSNKLPKEALAAHLADPALPSKIGDCDKILNLLPFDEALRLFRAGCSA